MSTEYGGDQIQILEGLEAVRKRPGMYIGSTSSRGLHHLVYEIVDNAVDEALAGFCSEINVVINEGDTITVTDNGRGIPVDINHKAGKPAVEVVFTILHAGGKFDNNAYKTSGGLHGVGSSVVNALSTYMDVQISREGYIHHDRYEKGVPVIELENGLLPKLGKTKKTGTKINFLPDPEIFEKTILHGEPVTRLMYEDNGHVYQTQEEIPFYAKQTRLVLRNCGHIDAEHIEDAMAVGAYESFEKAVFEMTPEAVIKTVTDAGLRGRGGAGFPAGRKWSQVASQPEKIRYVVCNGDEGDPGDRRERPQDRGHREEPRIHAQELEKQSGAERRLDELHSGQIRSGT